MADYFENVAAKHGDAKAAANWVMGEVLAWCNAAARPVTECQVTENRLASLLDLVRDGTVSHNAAKRIFAAIAEQGGEPRAIAERKA